MDKNLIRTVNQQIYKRFPQVDGKEPSVTVQRKGGNGGSSYQLTYRGQAVLSNEKKLPYIVRVTVSDSGKIQKITTSH